MVADRVEFVQKYIGLLVDYDQLTEENSTFCTGEDDSFEDADEERNFWEVLALGYFQQDEEEAINTYTKRVEKIRDGLKDREMTGISTMLSTANELLEFLNKGR